MLLLALSLQVTACENVMNRVECGPTTRGPNNYSVPQPAVAPPLLIGGGGGRWKPSKRQKRAGKMIAGGQCAEAEAYALGEGDFGLASQVRSTCRLRQK